MAPAPVPAVWRCCVNESARSFGHTRGAWQGGEWAPWVPGGRDAPPVPAAGAATGRTVRGKADVRGFSPRFILIT